MKINEITSFVSFFYFLRLCDRPLCVGNLDFLLFCTRGVTGSDDLGSGSASLSCSWVRIMSLIIIIEMGLKNLLCSFRERVNTFHFTRANLPNVSNSSEEASNVPLSGFPEQN